MIWIFRFFSIWPLTVLHALGAALGWMVWATNPKYRAQFRANVKQAGIDFELAQPAIAEAGKVVFELPKLWLRPHLPQLLDNPKYEVKLDGVESATEAFAQGNGVVFFGAHGGCFELMPQLLAEVFGPKHGDITAIYRPARQASLAAVELVTRQRPYLTVLPGSLRSIRMMHKALRANKAVAMLTDQVPPEGLGIWAPFFGKPAYTMTLAARLALQTGATLLPVSCERLPNGRGYIVKIRPAVNLPATKLPANPDLLSTVTHINQAIEAIVLSQPGQYLWGYGRYKTPRQEATAKDGV